jgi:hypothetical protein
MNDIKKSNNYDMKQLAHSETFFFNNWDSKVYQKKIFFFLSLSLCL